MSDLKFVELREAIDDLRRDARHDIREIDGRIDALESELRAMHYVQWHMRELLVSFLLGNLTNEQLRMSLEDLHISEPD